MSVAQPTQPNQPPSSVPLLLIGGCTASGKKRRLDLLGDPHQKDGRVMESECWTPEETRKRLVQYIKQKTEELQGVVKNHTETAQSLKETAKQLQQFTDYLLKTYS